jgi:hypothetical protein
MRCRGAGSSANQVLRGWEFSQPGVEGLEVRLIRFPRAESSTYEVSKGWKFSQSDFEGLGV